MVQQMAVPGFSNAAQLLFSLPPVDELDELAERLEKAFSLVKTIQNGLSEKESRDKLSQAASQSIEKYFDLMDGLLCGILTDSSSAERYLGDVTVLSMLNAEALGPLVKTLNILAQEKFNKLSDVARKQVVWLLRDMTKKGIANLDRVHIPFMRNLTTAEHWKNVPLLESYMEIFTENRPFVESPTSGPIVQMAILTFVQLIQYHYPLQYSVIKDKEMEFCLDLMRTRFADFSAGGREMARSLIAVSKLPKMKEFWNDLVNNPRNLPVYAGGLTDLLKARTPRWIYGHRVSTEMEVKITFLLSKIRAPLQTRYTDIFVKQYLSSPESEFLLPDLIRFVVRAIHPSNEILGSDVLQRWNFILILLTNVKTPQGLNNCMLALFYDWILFDPQDTNNSNIMNIEPAILLLMNLRVNTVRVFSKPLLQILIDYLCKIPFEFFPPLVGKIRKSVLDSFGSVIEKRVVVSLMPIYDAVSDDLRSSLRKSYPEVFGEDPAGPRLPGSLPGTANGNGNKGPPALTTSQKATPLLADVPMEANFSDTEEEMPVPPKRSSPNREVTRPKKQIRLLPQKAKVTKQLLARYISVLPESLQPLMVKMRDGGEEEKCSAMEDFVIDVINEGQNFDVDDCADMARTLALTIKPIYDQFKLPEVLSDESYEDSVQSPLFILYRRLWEETVESPQRERVLALLTDMTEFIPDIPFLLIYYMIYKDSKRSNNDDRDAMADFEDLCFAMRRKVHGDEKLSAESYEECIASCLERCGEHDHRMLVAQAEFFYRETPRVSRDSASVAHAVISHVDAWELRALWNLVLQKRMTMFSEKGCATVIKESLNWETIEQTFFWKLFHAHGFKGDSWMLELLKEIDFKKHPEATFQVIETLREALPREEIMREVLRQEPDDAGDSTFVTLAMQWSSRLSARQLAEDISKILAKLVSKKRTTNKSAPLVKTEKGELTVENILAHIASIQAFVASADRTGNKKGRDGDLTQTLYNQSMEIALAKARDSASPAVREKFREVFTLAHEDGSDEIEEVKVVSPKKAKKNSDEKTGGKKRLASGKSASSSRSRQSSDEDEPVTTKPKKHRNKSPPTVID